MYANVNYVYVYARKLLPYDSGNIVQTTRCFGRTFHLSRDRLVQVFLVVHVLIGKVVDIPLDHCRMHALLHGLVGVLEGVRHAKVWSEVTGMAHRWSHLLLLLLLVVLVQGSKVLLINARESMLLVVLLLRLKILLNLKIGEKG